MPDSFANVAGLWMYSGVREIGLIFAGIGASATFEADPLLIQHVLTAVATKILLTTTLVNLPGIRWALRGFHIS